MHWLRKKRRYDVVYVAVAETTLFPWHPDYRKLVRYFCTAKRARRWVRSKIGHFGQADIYYRTRRGRR